MPALVFLSLSLSVRSHDGSQTMEYNNNIKKLMLLVEVTNLPEQGKEAEDAHQAVLNITIPPTLKYSGWRQQVQAQCGVLSQLLCL